MKSLFFLTGFLALAACNNSSQTPAASGTDTPLARAAQASPPAAGCYPTRPVPCPPGACAVDSCAEKWVQAHVICEEVFNHMRTPGMNDTRSYSADELALLLAGADCRDSYVEITDDLRFEVHTRSGGKSKKRFETAFYNLPLFTQLLKAHPDSLVFYKIRRPDVPENPINAIFKVWKSGDVTGYFDVSGHLPPTVQDKH